MVSGSSSSLRYTLPLAIFSMVLYSNPGFSDLFLYVLVLMTICFFLFYSFATVIVTMLAIHSLIQWRAAMKKAAQAVGVRSSWQLQCSGIYFYMRALLACGQFLVHLFILTPARFNPDMARFVEKQLGGRHEFYNAIHTCTYCILFMITLALINLHFLSTFTTSTSTSTATAPTTSVAVAVVNQSIVRNERRTIWIWSLVAACRIAARLMGDERRIFSLRW